MTSDILDPNFKTDSIENIQRFVHNLLGYYVIMEGIFFYAGFAMMLNLMRHQKMVGVGEQFQYVLRDESIHLAFGADLLNTIVAENPSIWTESFKKDLTEKIKKAVELECAYAEDALPRGILGMNSEVVKQYMQYIGDRRLERIGLQPVYNTANPFPWMSEIMDLKKEKNFFETRVNEYKQGGALEW
jgi:ribonucleoside-diphosphate reductase beta chain